MIKTCNKILSFFIFIIVSFEALADPAQPFTEINANATMGNVSANSQTFLANLFEFFVNLGLVAGIIVGFLAMLKMKKVAAGEDNGGYAGPFFMLLVAGGLCSVWLVVFVFSNTVEQLAS